MIRYPKHISPCYAHRAIAQRPQVRGAGRTAAVPEKVRGTVRDACLLPEFRTFVNSANLVETINFHPITVNSFEVWHRQDIPVQLHKARLYMGLYLNLQLPADKILYKRHHSGS